MTREHLLPGNSTPFERSVSASLDRLPELTLGSEALHSFKFTLPRIPSVVPWLIVEYALGEMSPYLPNAETAIEYGLNWLPVKGTPRGITEALSWSGYAFQRLDEAPTRRTRWHLYAIELDRFRDNEADLGRIEPTVRMSGPERSDFWRGYFGYNAREFEWGYERWGNGIWGDCSGVRLHPGGVKWSFGRTFEPPPAGVHEWTEAELTALGVWVPPVGGGNLKWGAFPWTTPGLKWASSGEIARITAIAVGLMAKTYWVRVRRTDGSTIGLRKARAVHCVTPAFTGEYKVANDTYAVAPGLTARFYVEAMTDFGEGDGEAVGSWSLVVGGSLPPGTKPGVQWLPGNTLVGGVDVGGFAVPAGTAIGKTDREQFRGIFRIV